MSSPGFGQKATDILDKMIEAQGGRKVLEGIKDTTLLGSIEWVEAGGGSVSGTFTRYQKEPNKIRQEMEIMGMARTDAFDGEIAWTNEAGKLSEDTEKDAAEKKSWAQGYAALLHPEKYGIAYVLKGKEKIEGNDYFILEQTIPGGTPDLPPENRSRYNKRKPGEGASPEAKKLHFWLDLFSGEAPWVENLTSEVVS
jgi:hypothetical protein